MDVKINIQEYILYVDTVIYENMHLIDNAIKNNIPIYIPISNDYFITPDGINIPYINTYPFRCLKSYREYVTRKIYIILIYKSYNKTLKIIKDLGGEKGLTISSVARFNLSFHHPSAKRLCVPSKNTVNITKHAVKQDETALLYVKEQTSEIQSIQKT